MADKKIIFWNIKTEPDKGKHQYEEGIGAHKLSTIARKLGYDTVIFQDHQFGAQPELIRQFTKKSRCKGDNIVAFSLLSAGVPLLEELVRNGTADGLPVLIGGAGATIEPDKVLGLYAGKNVPVALVQGDGETAFEQLVQTPPRDWHKVDGVWSLDEQRRVVRGKFFVLDDLDSSPFADLGASEQRKMASQVVEFRGEALEARLELLKSLLISQVESGRGCYYKCEFCSTSSLEVSKVRKSSPQRLVAEMEHMFNEYGITFFSITDNVAFDKADWWLEFAGLMNDSPMTPYVQFGGYSAPKFLNKQVWLEKVVPALYDVGLRGIILGVQAGSRRVLKDVVHRSPDDPQNALEAVQRLVPLGLNIKVDFIVGHPTETLEDLEVTHQWINRIYEAGGETFVRKLGVVPHSGYHHKLSKGELELPEETPEYRRKLDAILGMKARDDRYKEIAFAGSRVPNKYLIDRKLGIVYPSTVFDLPILRTDSRRLEFSAMPPHIKHRYQCMFDLVRALKGQKKGYEF